MPVLVLAALTSLAGAAPDTVFISEVVYNPAGAEPDGEWVELINAGSTTVSLDELRLSDCESTPDNEGALVFPAGTTLAPGEVVVIANKASAYFSATGARADFEVKASDAGVPDLTADASLGSLQLNLANSTDEIFLLDVDGFIVDGVTWGRTTPVQGIADFSAPEGQSASRRFTAGVPQPWFASVPTPGVVEVAPDPSQTGEGEGEGEGEAGDDDAIGGEGEGEEGEGEGGTEGEGEGNSGEGEGEDVDPDPRTSPPDPALPIVDDGDGLSQPRPVLTRGNESTASGCSAAAPGLPVLLLALLRRRRR